MRVRVPYGPSCILQQVAGRTPEREARFSLALCGAIIGLLQFLETGIDSLNSTALQASKQLPGLQALSWPHKQRHVLGGQSRTVSFSNAGQIWARSVS